MMRSCRVLTLTCSLAFSFSALASAQEWTRFRGPNGSGVSEATTIPAQWTTDDYRWRVKLPGVGHSSPVIWGDRIFVTCGLEDATQIIRCLRTSDGGLIWKRSFESTTHRMNSSNCYASASPVVDADHVYMAWATPERYTVLALSQKDGREIWRRDLGPFASQHGFGASPILVDDLIIVPNDQDEKSSVIALDRASGETRWQCERRTDKAAFATPCVYQPDEGPPQLITSSSAHGVSGLDLPTGKMIWELPLFKHRVVGSPAIVNGLIFASAGSGGIGRQMFAVRPGNPQKGVEAQVAYEIKGSLPYVPTPVANGDLVFLWWDRGEVTCLEAPTGKEVWTERVGGGYYCSPVRVADRLYCVSRKGEMVVLSATNQFEELARFSLEEACHATPAVADGVMYLRTFSHLMAIGGDRAE